MNEDNRGCYTHSFARIYDDLMSSVPYGLWYDYLNEIFALYRFDPTSIIDLACGTGTMTFKFASSSDNILGLDKSSAMLNIAREKTGADSNVEFKCADLRKFELEKKYEFAFCLFDSLNYILKIDELASVFKNVAASLTENGLFIFDMNTPARLMSIEPGTTMIKGDEYTCFWEDIIIERKNLWEVKLKIYFDDGNKYYQEVHRETAYQKEEILEKLNEAGFEKVEVFRAYTFKEGDDDDNRLYYICFRDEEVFYRASPVKKVKKKIKWKFTNFRSQ